MHTTCCLELFINW